MEFVYDTTIDPEAENNSHAFCLSLVGFNKVVLEVGCATGYFSKVLVERGCDVVGIELNPEAAEVARKWIDRVVVGDLDAGELWNELPDAAFDVVTFGDVLEHLRDPLGALRAAVGKLKPSGFVVASVPNIAHGDVRLSLLQGTFRYRELGLLDQTHIRFFTLESLRELFHEAGLTVVELKRVVVPLFASELEVEKDSINPETLRELREDPEVETYQFVLKAVLDDGLQATAALSDRVGQLTDQVHFGEVRLARLRVELQEHLAGEERLAEQVRSLQPLADLNELLRTETKNLLEHVDILRGQLGEMQGRIDALADQGLSKDQSISALDHALAASEARMQALVSTKSYRMMAPLRALRRGFGTHPKPERS